MITMTLGELAGLVAGTLHGADASREVTGAIQFDSRKVAPGDVFLALPGERVDGHDYAAAAVRAGAVAAVVTRPVDAPHVLVGDGLTALAALAAAVVRRLPDCTVVGITGSSGKTSTKDVVAHLVRRLGPTVAPPGSYNNELGHPYTVLLADADTRFLVLEKSARNIGHIRYLTGIAPPRIGVVLNVGSAHLGIFGSREAIAQAKGELVEALPADGLAVLNADDPLVAAMASRTAARISWVGTAEWADIRALDVALDPLGRPSFTLVTSDGSVPVQLRLAGAHHVGNALSAAAVALECGMALDDVAEGLSSATAASRWRMELTERADGVLVINDAYNANPESMSAALQTLTAVARDRGARSWAVLGSMGELGGAAPGAHREVGRLAAELGVAELLAVGGDATHVLEGVRAAAGRLTRARNAVDIDDAVAVLTEELRAGDVVLVKASRAAGLERLATAITASTATGAGSGAAAGPAQRAVSS